MEGGNEPMPTPYLLLLFLAGLLVFLSGYLLREKWSPKITVCMIFFGVIVAIVCMNILIFQMLIQLNG